MSKKATYNYQHSPFYLQLKKFKAWLETQSYANDTIRPYSNYAGCFLEWLESEQLAATNVSYPDLMKFIKHYSQRDSYVQKQDSIGLLNRKLGAIRKYYEWLQ